MFVACLLPNPPDYAKVGGHWDVLATRTDHIKEGTVFLSKVDCKIVLSRGMNDKNTLYEPYVKCF